MFPDESRFTLDFHDRRNRVWRRRNEHFHDVNVRFGGGSLVVWDGITVTGRTALHIVYGRLTGLYYRDNILARNVFEFKMTSPGHAEPELLPTTFGDKTSPLYQGQHSVLTLTVLELLMSMPFQIRLLHIWGVGVGCVCVCVCGGVYCYTILT